MSECGNVETTNKQPSVIDLNSIQYSIQCEATIFCRVHYPPIW